MWGINMITHECCFVPVYGAPLSRHDPTKALLLQIAFSVPITDFRTVSHVDREDFVIIASCEAQHVT